LRRMTTSFKRAGPSGQQPSNPAPQMLPRQQPTQ
jgi:hypothetical protein